MVNIVLVLRGLALLCFLASALRVETARVDLPSAGLALLTLSILVA